MCNIRLFFKNIICHEVADILQNGFLPSRLLIVDIKGIIVLSKAIASITDIDNIDVSLISSGTYFTVLFDNKKYIVSKQFVVVRQ